MIKLKTKYFVIFFIVLFSFYGYSQENENMEEVYVGMLKSVDSFLLSSVIEMDIDKSIFPISKNNSHVTEDQKSGIMAILMPSSFDKLEKELKSKEGSSIIDKGILKNEGKRILFLKESMEHEGQIYYMLMFAKEYKDEASIMVTAFYKSSEDEDYIKYAERAIKSAKIVEKE